MIDHGRCRQAEVRSAVGGGYSWMTGGVRAHMQFVDDAFLPRRLEAGSGGREAGSHHGQRHVAERVDRRRVAEGIVGVRQEGTVITEIPLDAARPRIDEQLVWIKSQPGARIPRAGRPNSVTLPRTDPGDDSVPDSVRVLPKFDAIFVSVLVDQADLDARRSWGVDRELGSGVHDVGRRVGTETRASGCEFR